MKTSFCKYSGCGNDLILIDWRKRQALPTTAVVASLCDRKFGIGADGLIFLEKGAAHPYKMRYFNADGIEVDLCGNGVRCLAAFIKRLEPVVGSSFILETNAGDLKVVFQKEKDTVSVFHPFPKKVEKKEVPPDLVVDFLDTGVPHVVLFVPDADTAPLESIGPFIRHHPIFSPSGVNVNVASFMEDGKIKVRTFERGVEAETLACGTEVLASAIASKRALPLTIQTRSKEYLQVVLEENGQISLTGKAVLVFSGEIEVK